MEPDFPAAHSMDTHWFGVDRDGRVARFDTGEDGVVPVDPVDHVDLLAEASPVPMLQAAAEVGGVADGILDLDGAHPLGPEVTDQLRGESTVLAWRVVVAWERGVDLPEGLEVVAELPVSGTTAPRDTAGDDACELRGLVCDRLEAEAEAALRASPAFRGLFDGPAVLATELSEALADAAEDALWEASPALVGIYDFACDDYGGWPYLRRAVPSRPIRFEDIPQAARETVAWFRFDDLSFEDVRAVQPAEHARSCESWSQLPFYVSSDRRVLRAMPGREAELRDLVGAEELPISELRRVQEAMTEVAREKAEDGRRFAWRFVAVLVLFVAVALALRLWSGG